MEKCLLLIFFVSLVLSDAEAQLHATDTAKGFEKKSAAPNMTPKRVYKQLRYDENYEFLKDPELRSDYLDKLKYIPVGKNDSYLTLGGEVRLFYEHYQHEGWGATGVTSNGYLLQRYMVHADFHIGRRFRLFSQIKSGLLNGREGRERPVDVDRLDFNQLFIDINIVTGEQKRVLAGLVLRAGRHELDFGAGRMISIRELPNVRSAYDGFRIAATIRSWTIDAFAVRPAETNRGFFDNGTERGTDLWGVYAVHHFPHELNIDVFYLGNKRDRAPFSNGVAQETRHSVGGRLWHVDSRLNWDVEMAYQFGKFANGDIHAWGVSSRIVYSLSSRGLRPKVSLNAGLNSGDRSAGPDNNTFYPPAPNGAFFGAVGALGPGNVAGFAPKFSIAPTRNIFIDTYWYFFWRQQINDGVYNVPGFPSKPPLSNSRFIGSQAEIDIVWQVAAHQTLVFVFANFFNGQFIRETPPARQITYAAAWYTYKF